LFSYTSLSVGWALRPKRLVTVPLDTGDGSVPLFASKFLPATEPSEDKVSGLYVGAGVVDLGCVLFPSEPLVFVAVFGFSFSFSFRRCSSFLASAKIAD